MLRWRLHPLQASKKYVCKQTVDCCRECNTPSTCALAWPGTLIVRVCTERTNACATVSTKNRTRNYPTSFQHYVLLINPPPLHPPRNPEYWYSRLQPGSMCWMRPFELYFLHVQYNFKQLPLCESCCPECWQELLISLVLFLNIFFNNMRRFFLSFILSFLFFFVFLLMATRHFLTKWQE